MWAEIAWVACRRCHGQMQVVADAIFCPRCSWTEDAKPIMAQLVSQDVPVAS